MPFLVESLRTEVTDAVAYDSNAIWGYMAASSLNLPKISFMTTLMLGAADCKRLTAREMVTLLLPICRISPERSRRGGGCCGASAEVSIRLLQHCRCAGTS